jgi:hypothetical protein
MTHLTTFKVSVNSAHVPSMSESTLDQKKNETSASSLKSSKLAAMSRKLNPFCKNETPEERDIRLREKKGRKEFIAKYGGSSSEARLQAQSYVRGMNGGKTAAFGAGATIGGGGA